MKIRQVGAELFHVDGRTDEQTDITKLIVAFRNFANAPQNIYATSVGVCMCGCFGNMCTCIYSVLYCFVYVYLLFLCFCL